MIIDLQEDAKIVLRGSMYSSVSSNGYILHNSDVALKPSATTARPTSPVLSAADPRVWGLSGGTLGRNKMQECPGGQIRESNVKLQGTKVSIVKKRLEKTG